MIEGRRGELQQSMKIVTKSHADVEAKVDEYANL
jgi:hypothetical protein